MIDAPCSTPGCPEKVALWAHQVAPGTHWHCPDCGTHNGITLNVTKLEDEMVGQATTSSELDQGEAGGP